MFFIQGIVLVHNNNSHELLKEASFIPSPLFFSALKVSLLTLPGVCYVVPVNFAQTIAYRPNPAVKIFLAIVPVMS